MLDLADVGLGDRKSAGQLLLRDLGTDARPGNRIGHVLVQRERNIVVALLRGSCKTCHFILDLVTQGVVHGHRNEHELGLPGNGIDDLQVQGRIHL